MSTVGQPARSQQQCLDRLVRGASSLVDVEAIRQAWLALGSRYRVEDRRLPLPVWARRGLTESGEQAWTTLRRDLGEISSKAFCVYIHVPFCASRCGFCDCYSFPLRQHRDRHVDSYVALLIQEIRLWSEVGLLRLRPVSTVHLGGGTPTFLGEKPFRRVIHSLREHLSAGPRTEWALESTTSDLTEEMFLLLNELGFTRLHIGVQTLEQDVRQSIGRREPAPVVLSKIAAAVESGWVVSVDLIVGLPGQTLPGVLADIQALERAGVDGFSVYELQLSRRNREFAGRHSLVQREHLGNYFLFHAASQYLEALGYRKTLFNHFARERDTNLYFTFPERGEDCLAVGTIADGMFGDYHYRHPEYRLYCHQSNETFPGLQGGLRKSALENHLYPLEVAILSGRLPGALFEDRLGRASAGDLIREWRASALVRDGDRDGDLLLTANGSWFTGNMIERLSRMAGSSGRFG